MRVLTPDCSTRCMRRGTLTRASRCLRKERKHRAAPPACQWHLPGGEGIIQTRRAPGCRWRLPAGSGYQSGAAGTPGRPAAGTGRRAARAPAQDHFQARARLRHSHPTLAGHRRRGLKPNRRHRSAGRAATARRDRHRYAALAQRAPLHLLAYAGAQQQDLRRTPAQFQNSTFGQSGGGYPAPLRDEPGTHRDRAWPFIDTLAAGGGENRRPTGHHQAQHRRTSTKPITKPNALYGPGVAPVRRRSIRIRGKRTRH